MVFDVMEYLISWPSENRSIYQYCFGTTYSENIVIGLSVTLLNIQAFKIIIATSIKKFKFI